ncbi:hypothetical protein GXW82_14435 [Streptacidiphilus sp. 4-A2]|nr:hypothetical protein [Streptacidiphilus sp. 4-A2]
MRGTGRTGRRPSRPTRSPPSPRSSWRRRPPRPLPGPAPEPGGGRGRGRVGVGVGVGTDDDSASAWDLGGAAALPLLWALATTDEEEAQTPGYSTAEEGAWGESPAAAAAAPLEEEPRFATWRPNRSVPATAAPQSTVVYRSGADPSYAAGEEPQEQSPEGEPEAGNPAEEAPSRTAADLLVQESDTWGVANDDDFGAII